MKIIFLCGSLEPGKDGVGDYSRRLAGELIRQGHQSFIISLYDVHVQRLLFEEQESRGIVIPLLRLGGELSDKRRIATAKEKINLYKPDWISLQFVPFSFQKKGLPWKLAKQLSLLGKDEKWHIMFHEIWVEGYDKKSKILSLLQQCIIKNMARRLNPEIAHTHLPAYKNRLRKAGIKTKNLSIFSNLEELENPPVKITEIFTIGFFSQVRPRISVNIFLKELIQEITSTGKDFQILIIGGKKEANEILEVEINLIPGVENKIKQTGFLEGNNLLQTIDECHLGMTPVPRHVLGKSGSVAAFLSRGIPVAAPYVKPGYESLEIGFFKPKIARAILIKPTLFAFSKADQAAKSISGKLKVETIAPKFLSNLISSQVSKKVQENFI